MGLLDDLGAWLDQGKRRTAHFVQNPGLLWAQLNEDARQYQQDQRANWGDVKSVVPEVKAAGLLEFNRSGQELGGMLGTFAGVGAKTADVVKLEQAKKMAKAGADPVEVWKQTGWTDQFPDGKWRFEISDDKAKPIKIGWGSSESLKHGDNGIEAVSSVFRHPDLGKAYPGTSAGYDAKGNRLVARIFPNKENAAYEDGGLLTVGADLGKDGNWRIKPSQTLHELQHDVQQREGFASGGSPALGVGLDLPAGWRGPEGDAALLARQIIQWEGKHTAALNERLKDSAPETVARARQLAKEKTLDELRAMAGNADYEYYRRLAGEAEARLTQSRMNLTPAERAARPPWLEFDVPREEQIVRGLLGEPTGPAMSVDDELIKRAKQHFGTTYSPAETGYILPDGTRLDLSGRHYAQGYQQQGERYVPQPGQPDYLRGGRNTDHRELPDTLSALHGTDAMIDFMNRSGAVRYMPDVGATVVDTAPVKMKQIQALVRDFRSQGAPLNVDISTAKGGDKVSKEFSRPTVESVADWLKRNGVNVSALGVLGLLGAGAYGQEQ